jgi:hypothetical protein
MIILLISIIWLATLVLVVAMCRMAAHSDRTALRHAANDLRHEMPRSPRLLSIPAPWEQASSLTLRDRRGERSGAGSEAAAAEHVGNRAQEDLYVSP